MLTTTADIVTIFGFLVSVAGFWIAIVQIRKAKRSSDEATRAVSEFRDELSNLNTVELFSKVLSSIEDLKRFIRSKAYSVIPDRLQEIRHTLITIREAGLDIESKQAKAFQDAISTFKILEDSFEQMLFANEIPEDDPSTLREITNHADKLKAIQVQLRKTIENGQK